MNNELLVKISEADLNLEQLRVLRVIVNLKTEMLITDNILRSTQEEQKVIE